MMVCHADAGRVCAGVAVLALLTPVLAKQSVWIIFVLRFLQVRLQLQSEAFLLPFFLACQLFPFFL